MSKSFEVFCGESHKLSWWNSDLPAINPFADLWLGRALETHKNGLCWEEADRLGYWKTGMGPTGFVGPYDFYLTAIL